jgi:hypothetical protein
MHTFRREPTQFQGSARHKHKRQNARTDECAHWQMTQAKKCGVEFKMEWTNATASASSQLSGCP